MKKARIIYPVIVEGKYDKIKLDSVFSATVLVSGGFGVFNSKEKQALLRRLAKDGIILLLDSDGGGVQIRSFLNSILPKDKVHNLYIPEIEGKERRKLRPSRAGTLGVEGMEREVLERIFKPFIETDGQGDTSALNDEASEITREMITKVDFYVDGLSGGANSSALRDALAKHFELPSGMTANALLEALNLITDKAGYRFAVASLDKK